MEWASYTILEAIKRFTIFLLTYRSIKITINESTIDLCISLGYNVGIGITEIILYNNEISESIVGTEVDRRKYTVDMYIYI